MTVDQHSKTAMIMIHFIAGMIHLKYIISKLCWSINFGPLNTPKTVDEWHKAWNSSSKPRTSSSPAGYPIQSEISMKIL